MTIDDLEDVRREFQGKTTAITINKDVTLNFGRFYIDFVHKTILTPEGEVQLTIIIRNQEVTVRALVLDINADVLLGTDALHHLGAKISIGGAEFPIDLPNIPMVEAMLLATKPIRVNPTVTELHYKLIPSCDACERHAPSVTINVYGENTTNYAIASKYTPALNTAQTTNTPLDPDPCVCNEASSATERLPPSSPKTITTDTAKTINKRQATKAKATKNRDPTIKNG